jgi:hypothetical protein
MNTQSYGIKPFLKSIFKIDKWNDLKDVEILLMVHDGHRSYEFEGKKYSPLIDSIQDSFKTKNIRFLTIAEPYSQFTGDKAYGNVLDFNGSFARCSIQRKLMLIFRKESFPGFFGYKNVFLKILSRIKPKIVICVSPSNALCSACKDLGIWVADLQHGVITDRHQWYGEKYRESTPREELPDCFLCWDEESAATIRKWAIKKNIEVKVIGNPWTIRFFKNSLKDKLVCDANHFSPKRDNNLPNILITLGWGFLGITEDFLLKKYKTPFNFKQSSGFSIALTRIIKSEKKKYNWMIRLHPVQLVGLEYPIITKYLEEQFSNIPEVDWLGVSSEPLPLVLQKTDLHITFGSTITSEAAIFGINTAMLAPNPIPVDWLKSYYDKEKKNGIAKFVYNQEEDILDFINNNLGQQKKVKKDELFIDNYRLFIEEISEKINHKDLYTKHVLNKSN